MSIFPMISPSSLSSLNSISSSFSNLSLCKSPPLRTPTLIRMGGGPRTFPGGVSKWQWKRMQAKKSKQLLKARLARERQIYEMRKRAELKAALSDLERPWEAVQKAPTLFSVKADDQLKVLADRFQKPGGFDMWSQEDGPELFKNGDELESARFFPKGVVHSLKPYGKVGEIGRIGDGGGEGEDELIDWRSVLGGGGSDEKLRAKTEKGSDDFVGDGSNERAMRNNVYKKKRDRRSRNSNGLDERSSREVVVDEGNVRRNGGQVYNKRDYRMQNSRHSTASEGSSSREVAVDQGNGRRNLGQVYNKRDYRMQNNRDSTASEESSLREMAVDEGNGRRNLGQVYNKRDYRMQHSSQSRKESTEGEVYDLRLERDGRYEFRQEH